ncbi:sister chromatid cohesion protein Dcc1 [Naematelia encephala]|uniref:Sister chromatid cohesion protein Dcc1 n=1 Tax=Naematelia encephala TaxID=71784 RepID=A0A1Y2AUT0_9TREE|nr:sister chromatid cohesion protein Dcc1 [Naematelia encephala]
MPIATTLPSSSIVLRYPTTSTSTPEVIQEESYQLLELPAEILKAVEKSSEPFPLTIKGRPNDDAVLCTPSTTFLLRTVTISNSLLILRPPPPRPATATRTDPTLEIRDTCHQVLECVPQAASLERIRTVLRESAWEGTGTLGKRKRGDKEPRRYTREMLGSVIQGSEVELERGLKERNVIPYRGRMMLLPLNHLHPLLSLVLALLTIHHTTIALNESPPTAVSPSRPLQEALDQDHEIDPEITRGVMGLFGEMDSDGEVWTCRPAEMVREIGKGLLGAVKSSGMGLDKLLNDWKEAVGETWSDLVNVNLLEGDHLLVDPPPAVTSQPRLIVPFPLYQLPLNPATRFADLFLTRPKWRPDDMIPFLKGLYRDGDSKERDKLVAKFVRVVKEGQGAWWYPRRSV